MTDLDPNLRRALDDLVPEGTIVWHDWGDVLRRAEAAAPSPPRRRRGAWSRRTLLLMAAGLIVAGSSIAFGARFVADWVHDDGDTAVARSLDQADMLLPGTLTPDQTGERIRIVASTGEWRLYETSMSDDRSLVTILPPRSLDGSIIGSGFRLRGAITAVGSDGRYPSVGGRPLLDLGGEVSSRVARVEARFADGTTIPVALRERWFLYVGDPGGPVPLALVARDANENVVGQVPVDQYVSFPPSHEPSSTRLSRP